MTDGRLDPIGISISDITYVDFKHKRVLENRVFTFEKLDLLHEGLIDFQRLLRRGHPVLVAKEGRLVELVVALPVVLEGTA